MIEYILVEKETDYKASHTYFSDDVEEAEITAWIESIDTSFYDIYKKIEIRKLGKPAKRHDAL